jgi:alpha-1,6-mannosyltransferase
MRTERLAGVLLAGLVAGQYALVTLAPTYAGPRPTAVGDVLPLIALLAAPAAIGLAALPRLLAVPPTSRALLVVLAGGLIMRLLWLGAPAPLEDDYHRYLWDGALVSHGLNPYALSPSEVRSAHGLAEPLAALQSAGSATLAHINFPDLKTIYPGFAQLALAVAHLIAPWSLDGLRVMLLGAELATVAILLALLRQTGSTPLLVALYWLNPLVVFTVIATIHLDGLLPPLLLGAVLLVGRGWFAASAALLALAVGTKIWPVLLAPLLLGEIVRRGGSVLPATALFCGIAIAATAPLLLSGLDPSSGLAAYASGWSNNNGFHAWASYWVYVIAGESSAGQSWLRLVAASVAGGVALGLAFRPSCGTSDVLRRMTIIAATVFYASPAQFPWYALWFLPLAAVTGNRALLLASATLPAYYLFFPLWESGRANAFVYGCSFLHSVPVLMAIGWRERTRLRDFFWCAIRERRNV